MRTFSIFYAYFEHLWVYFEGKKKGNNAYGCLKLLLLHAKAAISSGFAVILLTFAHFSSFSSIFKHF
eukprot:NODE_264_length_1105_cov_415.436553_g213_i0.p2 GENE.NODE_264_length_1105_cov_415.436553_g213_i0~~NODE_264_length_1105_cov_415.436553_g213_i0.p2  ORF type:complete len:67 (+),score=2.35 NODE_264_length_1105_cov_415.436553_g213_i0:619-819(+)